LLSDHRRTCGENTRGLLFTPRWAHVNIVNLIDLNGTSAQSLSTHIRREIRVLPNRLRCAYCDLSLVSYQELKEADLGGLYTIAEEEDPIDFFGIEPEDYIDVEDVVRRYGEDMAADYQNE
jgi:hypothetical protein